MCEHVFFYSASKVFASLSRMRFREKRSVWVKEKPHDGGFFVINLFEERLLVGFCRLEQLDTRERIDRIILVV